MAKAKKAKVESTVIEDTSESINSQIEAFLASGNKIQEIPIGTSGIKDTGGTKHITISRNRQDR